MRRIISVLFVGIFLACEPKGSATMLLTGEEATLPEELKGLKVYNVAYTNDGSYIKVAVLGGKVNSVQYPVGKHQESAIIVDNSGYTRREITVKGIILENDTMIIARK